MSNNVLHVEVLRIDTNWRSLVRLFVYLNKKKKAVVKMEPARYSAKVFKKKKKSYLLFLLRSE